MRSKRIRAAINKGRRGQTTDDVISAMPDDLLLSILCLMPLKDAATTASLSTRWRYLWCHMSSLDFQDRDALERIANDRRFLQSERNKFINSVNSILRHHKARIIQDFRIRFDLDYDARNSIDKWIRFALTKNLMTLELDFLQNGKRLRHPEGNYVFQKSLLDKRPPYTLKWRALNIIPIKMPFLRKVVMKGVSMDDEVLEILLKSCAVLETLSIIGSSHLSTVNIGGSSLQLKHLEISYCFEITDVHIYDFNLVSFAYKGSAIDLSLEDLPKLEQLYVGEGHSGFENNLFDQISSCLLYVQFLTFDVYHPSQSLKVLEIPELPKVKKLGLRLGAWNDNSLLDCTLLAKACPCLKTLSIELVWVSPVKRRRKLIRVENHPHQHLETLEFTGYYGRISDLELAVYFIENAVALKEIVIDPCCKDPKWARVLRDLSRKEDAARSAATRQFQSLAPPGVKLVIL